MNKKEQHKLTENVGEVMFIRALIVNKAETFTFSASSSQPLLLLFQEKVFLPNEWEIVENEIEDTWKLR